MSATDSTEASVLNLIFKNTTWANVGDVTGIVGSTSAGSLYVSLHTSDAGETGSQTTNEVGTGAYAGYARVAVARSGAGWTVSGTAPTQVTNASTVTFPACTGGTGATITHFGIGTASSGAGVLLFKGALTSSLAVSNGITPSFSASNLTVTCD